MNSLPPFRVLLIQLECVQPPTLLRKKSVFRGGRGRLYTVVTQPSTFLVVKIIVLCIRGEEFTLRTVVVIYHIFRANEINEIKWWFNFNRKI